jgi:hypothetical protein
MASERTPGNAPMARNRTPQTQEKRRREFDKQRERQEKIAKRNARNAAKREAKKSGIPLPPPQVLDPRLEFFPPPTPEKE